ncbi:GtrA family protein [Fredinandcohnia sp. QZ13]|uniref:GtrA family protein n=1 Tax=Fredinandcohnia sp. QZ13 TaxID=3073144 RepID=UPI0028535E09|nr:GtrA family protein [Fredinandcohnia sp. QZ13]MDR4889485.1 GtrA family protein [Fredinandcohnia sp. QZ13]
MITTHFPKPTNTFVRFLLVGVINTLVGLSSIFLLLDVVSLSYWLSTFVGHSIGAGVSYMLNRQFTFASKAMHGKSIPLFVLVILSCYFLSFSMSKMISGFIFTQYTNEIAVFLGTGLYTVMNYLGQKYLVFSS